MSGQMQSWQTIIHRLLMWASGTSSCTSLRCGLALKAVQSHLYNVALTGETGKISPVILVRSTYTVYSVSASLTLLICSLVKQTQHYCLR